MEEAIRKRRHRQKCTSRNTLRRLDSHTGLTRWLKAVLGWMHGLGVKRGLLKLRFRSQKRAEKEENDALTRADPHVSERANVGEHGSPVPTLAAVKSTGTARAQKHTRGQHTSAQPAADTTANGERSEPTTPSAGRLPYPRVHRAQQMNDKERWRECLSTLFLDAFPSLRSCRPSAGSSPRLRSLACFAPPDLSWANLVVAHETWLQAARRYSQGNSGKQELLNFPRCLSTARLWPPEVSKYFSRRAFPSVCPTDGRNVARLFPSLYLRPARE